MWNEIVSFLLENDLFSIRFLFSQQLLRWPID